MKTTYTIDMRKLLFIFALLAVATIVGAQNTDRKQASGQMKAAHTGAVRKDSSVRLTLLTENRTLSGKINKAWTESRSLMDVGASALVSAAKGQIGAASVSLISAGVQGLYNLFTMNKTRKARWLKAVQEQNVWNDSITTIEEVKDFYAKISKDGALDPSDMQFDGFDLRYTDSDGATALHVHCSVDTTEVGLLEITNHGKFLLRLDTLYVNPYLCHLPVTNGEADGYEFEFEEGADEVSYTLDFRLRASWMTEAIEYFNDKEIGAFKITLTLNKAMLNTAAGSHMAYRYVAGETDGPGPRLTGESLIVPRSYLGLSKKPNGETDDVWGTGQFNVRLKVSESRRIDENIYWMEKDNRPKYWKDDYDRRTKYKPQTFTKWLVQSVGKDGQTVVTTIFSTTATAMVNDVLGISMSTAAQQAGGGAPKGK